LLQSLHEELRLRLSSVAFAQVVANAESWGANNQLDWATFRGTPDANRLYYYNQWEVAQKWGYTPLQTGSSTNLTVTVAPP
jgi:hypothetical protein